MLDYRFTLVMWLAQLSYIHFRLYMRLRLNDNGYWLIWVALGYHHIDHGCDLTWVLGSLAKLQ